MTDKAQKKIQQVGLTSDSLDEIDNLGAMIDKFNRYHNELLVELDYFPTPAHELSAATGKYRLLFTFAHRQAQQAFWFGNF